MTVHSGGPVRDSLVGLAPFAAGTAVLLLVTYRVFDVTALGQALAHSGWSGLIGALPGLWQVPDVWLWGYVIFVVSNAMIPSPADRQPWLVASIYAAVALTVAWLLGGLQILDEAVRHTITGLLQAMTIGFVFSIAVNAIVAAALWLLETVVIGVQRQKT